MKITVPVEIDVPDGLKLTKVETGELVKFKGGSEIFIRVHFEEIRPAKKVIDLSCIVGSGIDCEFSDSENFLGQVVGGLSSINKSYLKKGGLGWSYCRIRKSPHVHFWAGGDKCPLPEGLKVRLHFRDGGISEYSGQIDYFKELWRWADGDMRGEVIAFEVLGVAEGWRYEWEEE